MPSRRERLRSELPAAERAGARRFRLPVEAPEPVALTTDTGPEVTDTMETSSSALRLFESWSKRTDTLDDGWMELTAEPICDDGTEGGRNTEEEGDGKEGGPGGMNWLGSEPSLFAGTTGS